MLRNEVENRTGLTRKAIEYYEEKGLIKPSKNVNGYREYTDAEVQSLTVIATYRRLGLQIEEIREVMKTDRRQLSSVLREHGMRLEREGRKQRLLERFAAGEDITTVRQELSVLEREESLYERLQRAFPGYFGQYMFMSYRPFLNEMPDAEAEQALREYICFLDKLPPLPLTAGEKEILENASSDISNADIETSFINKVQVVEDPEQWLKENEDMLAAYEKFKDSEAYASHPVVMIQQKLKKYLEEQGYYTKAIPLLRAFSRSYDVYYQKLLQADVWYQKYHRKKDES